MIKISHESPLSMLALSRTYNDYDYALTHLFEENQNYFNFFKESLEIGRTVLLDCSTFELGEAFDRVKYASWINKLKPTEYIIPDVLESCDGTIGSAENWMSVSVYHVHTQSKIIGVVQGKNYGELVKCYTTLDKLGVNKLAISFDYSYYTEVFPHPNKWVSFMMGRVLTLTRLMNDGIINKNKPHHLLGCSHPREFSFYTGPEYAWIETLDTSSPIVHGLKGISYCDKIGTWEKEKTKLVDLLDAHPDKETLKLIYHNIALFKNYLK
jgi:hypothetical protein